MRNNMQILIFRKWLTYHDIAIFPNIHKADVRETEFLLGRDVRGYFRKNTHKQIFITDKTKMY